VRLREAHEISSRFTPGRPASRLVSGLAVVLVVVLGLAPVEAGAQQRPAAQAEKPLVLYHWWSSPSEMKALGALVGVFKARYPGATEKQVAAPDRGTALFTALQGLRRAGNPPDAVVMQAGYALRPFVVEGLLAPLDALWASEGLDRAIPPTLRALHRFEGHYYSIPIDVQRTNLVWYNSRVLAAHGVDPAALTSWDRFFEAAARLRAEGVAAPLQLAASWTVAQLFESIVASAGTATYEDWVNGKIRSASDPRLRNALETLKRYVSFANRDHADLDWAVALRRVARGESAFYAMGDWANGEFRAAGLAFGKEYGALVVPGTDRLYGVTIDAFVQPSGLARTTSSTRWLTVAASREGQDAFNLVKGSIPARTDPAADRYDGYQRSAIAAFKRSAIYPTYGAATPGVYVRGLEAALGAFAADGDVGKAATAIAGLSVSSASSFTNVWALD
jgi:glucose/mannose transport system substrate-binding protein